MRTMKLCLLLMSLLLPSAGLGQALPAKRSTNYDPSRRDGRFDLRVRVDGSVDFFIRTGEIRYQVRSGAPPRDEGSEYRQELPRGETVNLQLEQRDGRNPIRIVEKPSRRNNYTLIISIDDSQSGGDRYHARITWDDYRPSSPFEGGRERVRSPDQQGPPRYERETGRQRYSNIQPRRGACFYEDSGYRGNYFCLESGEREPRLRNGWNDRVRSIRVFGGARVSLCSEEDFRGAFLGLAVNITDLRDFFYSDRSLREWNNAVSSIRVD
jgi:hypothetical protein